MIVTGLFPVFDVSWSINGGVLESGDAYSSVVVTGFGPVFDGS